MLTIKTFNVGHGSCNLIVTPTGHLILVDCGSSNTWKPSSLFNGYNLKPSSLIITNFDEDHINDLPNLDINSIIRNFSITPEWLYNEKIKTGYITPAMEKLINIMLNWQWTSSNFNQNYGIEIITFYLSINDFISYTPSLGSLQAFPIQIVDSLPTTNDLSLLTIVKYNGFSIAFTGDLTTRAWKKLLIKYDWVLKNELAQVNCLIAPHHGRDNGYCEEVFYYCKPDITIISDSSKQYDTQDHQLYQKHSNGVVNLRNYRDIRRVFTTRSDGSINITVESGNNYIINTDLLALAV